MFWKNNSHNPSFPKNTAISKVNVNKYYSLYPRIFELLLCGLAAFYMNYFMCYMVYKCCFSKLYKIRSDQSISCVRLFVTPWIAAHQAPCPSPTPRVHWDSCPGSQWCHPAISSSVVPFSSCPQSLPASESFSMSQHFIWGGQSTGVSALASFLPKNTQGWSPLEWTGWISLDTTVQKHQFFGTQPSSQSNSHIHTWPQEKP